MVGCPTGGRYAPRLARASSPGGRRTQWPSLPSARGGLLALWLLLVALPARADEPAAAPALLDASTLVANVLALADRRLALMPSVAAAKWPRHLPVADPARERTVIDEATSRASALGLAPDGIAAYLGVQISLARDAQQRLFDRWRDAGFGVATPIPDLAGDLRPQLDRIGAETLRALYLAAPLAADPGFRVRALAQSAASLPDVRWSAVDRAALVDTLAAVRSRGPASLAHARAAGILRVGTPGDYAPFSVATTAGLVGADVDLALALARELGLEVAFIRSSWRGLLDDLRGGRFDLAIGGISVTAARARAATFSPPTSRSGKTAIGRCADAARLTRLEQIDRPEVTVVFNPGGTNESFARSHAQRARLLEHTDNRTIFEELEVGHADVMFTDEIEVALASHRHPQLCRLLPESFEPADKAFLMPSDSDWAAIVDPWLERELALGTPTRLLQRHLEH